MEKKRYILTYQLFLENYADSRKAKEIFKDILKIKLNRFGIDPNSVDHVPTADANPMEDYFGNIEQVNVQGGSEINH